MQAIPTVQRGLPDRPPERRIRCEKHVGGRVGKVAILAGERQGEQKVTVSFPAWLSG